MALIRRMCPLNVERFCWRLCASPISARMRSNQNILHGFNGPEAAASFNGPEEAASFNGPEEEASSRAIEAALF